MRVWLVAALVGVVGAAYVLATRVHGLERIQAGMRFTVRGASDPSQTFPMVATADQDDETQTVAAVFRDSQGNLQPETVPLSAIVSVGY